MQTVSYSEARENLKAVMDKAVADRAPILVTRQRGENVVMISASEWAGMEETLHLLRSPKNAERMLASIAELDAGNGEEHELIEPVRLTFSSRAWDEYLAWQTEDPKLLSRTNAMIKECMRDPFRGTGKPEPLGGGLSGWWSRRIDRERRLVYRMTGKGDAQVLQVAQCRYHY